MERTAISGHETTDAGVRWIAYTGVALAAGAALCALIVYGIFQYLSGHPPSTALVNPMAQAEPNQFPPAPRIEEHPALEVQELRAQEDQLLNSYGWTDKEKGSCASL